LSDNGWKVLVIWECQLKVLEIVTERLSILLSSESPNNQMQKTGAEGNLNA
jgi:G:T-mismatch repair DNA endonuclease (very short patch repair protein)